MGLVNGALPRLFLAKNKAQKSERRTDGKELGILSHVCALYFCKALCVF